ncbi:hypothetical protein ACHAW6_012364 [Cyclotella cf. meneghiniana]
MTPLSGRNRDGGVTCTASNTSDRCNEQTFSLPPLKTVQPDDDVTTAYSSWNDEDDNHDEFSPCRSTQDDQVAIGNDDDSGSREDVKIFSSSDRKYDTTLQLTILYERAAMLLRRERSLEYRITNNYCLAGQAIASFSKLSLQDTHKSDMSAAGVVEREDHASASPSTSIIDATCRSKMMEWAIRVVEFSYPPPRQLNSHFSNTPRHSRETLCIISSAFSYVDRIMTQSLIQTCYPQDRKKVLVIATRKEYKLLCMICLHLAAKVSGLFGSGDGVQYPVTKNGKDKCGCDRRRAIEVFSDSASRSRCSSSVSTNSAESIGTANITSCSSSNSLAESSGNRDTSSKVKKNERHTTMNHHPSRIIPTQRHHHHGQHPYNHNNETIGPRPSLNLLSLAGLYSLCQGEFTVDEMCRMELSILNSLDWKLHSGLVLEWFDLIVEWGVFYINTSEDFANSTNEELATLYDWEKIREFALFQLGTAMKMCEFMSVIPSVLALAALANTTEKYDDSLFLVSRAIRAFGFSYGVDDLLSVMTAIKFHLKSGADNVQM